MSVDESLLRRLEHLSGLRLSKDEREQFSDELSRILVFIRQLADVDTTDVKPCAHPGDLTCPRRTDKLETSLAPEQALAPASVKQAPFFMVPGIFDAWDGEGGDV